MVYPIQMIQLENKMNQLDTEMNWMDIFSKKRLNGNRNIVHYIEKSAFFCSVLRDDFTLFSDIDILVEFHPEHIPGLIRLSLMENELSYWPSSKRLAYQDHIIFVDT